MIVVENLWKSFGEHQVLKGLSLRVEKGETVVILGRSGVGKSVLLKHMIAVLQPDEGSIEIDGGCVTTMKEKDRYQLLKQMGMLFQGAALFDSMNIFENTAFHLRQHGDPETGTRIAESELQDRVAEALEMVDLAGTQSKMPSDLSGGMKKRAALARIIIYRPRILLYDEPTTGLDSITAMQINELILQIQNDLQATSVVVTHDINSALKVGDKLALHHEGKLAHCATKEEFLQIQDPLVVDFFENTLLGKTALIEGVIQ
jgi:phospholipid/cholesterol/gamma-HCH transport system ATP-binding protein